MNDDWLPFGPVSGQGSIETVSDFYRRKADRERQCADEAIDSDLRRIHLDRATMMMRMAEAAQLKQ